MNLIFEDEDFLVLMKEISSVMMFAFSALFLLPIGYLLFSYS